MLLAKVLEEICQISSPPLLRHVQLLGYQGKGLPRIALLATGLLQYIDYLTKYIFKKRDC